MKIPPDRSRANPAAAAILAMTTSSDTLTRRNAMLAELRHFGSGA